MNCLTKNRSIPESYIYVSLVFTFALLFLAIWVSDLIMTRLGSASAIGFIPFARTYISVGFASIIVPLSVMIEIIYSKWRRRGIRPLNVLVFLAIFAEYIAAMIAISFLFDSLFPGLSFQSEPFSGLTGLALGSMVGIPLIIILLTSRIPRIAVYVKRAVE